MRYLLSLMLMILLSSPVMAAKSHPEGAAEAVSGGFEGPARGAEAETVANALKLANDSKVVLVGNIVASVSDAKSQYYFKDDSGEIRVQIPPKQFKDNKINPETKVRLIGKIEKGDKQGDVKLRVSKLIVVK